MVAKYCAFEPGTRVADLCAAPGGKALAIASEGVEVIACDLSPARSRLIRQASIRLGASVSTCVSDAEHVPFGEVDGVLLDVPCTGTGTMRRHPDTRWKLTPAAIGSLVDVQKRLLEAAAQSVRVGGTLVYATCSLENEENEGQVERFLTRHPEFTLKSPPPRVTEPMLSVQRDMREGILSLLPTDTGYDGAFAARMVRIR
jgi:16S rRNA (cytosine967-C5)-methyltransferase